MMDTLATLLVLPMVYGLFVVVRGIWRLFMAGSPDGGGGSRAGGQPWTPYQSPGAPMGPSAGFGAGLMLGHWMGEHGHDDGMALGMGMGAAGDDDGLDGDD